MKWNAIQRNVLAVFAHPDDDVLSCFGTLARLHQEHHQVYVLTMTSGEQSQTAIGATRLREAEAAAQLVGYNLIQECLPDGSLCYNTAMVSLIERHIQNLQIQTLITHYPQELGQGHQDHIAVASAALNAARRKAHVETILYAEPPTQNGDFSPNLFIDITKWMELKKRAISCHCSENLKPYMHPQLAEIRARWWASQAYVDENNVERMCEPFIIVKSVMRLPQF